jgi:uncharacterized short protein YbdD (DUF466 family)
MNKLLTTIKQTLYLMVGMGDYQAYVMHCEQHHPGYQAMSEKDYFLHRLNARYPGKKNNLNRCPC